MIDVCLGVRQVRNKGMDNSGDEYNCSTGGRNESTDFFSCADTSVDFVDKFSPNHLVEDDPSTRIQHLFVGGSVRLAFKVCMLTWTLPVYADAKVVWLINFRYSRRKFRQGSQLVSGLVFPRGSGGSVYRYWSVDSGEWSNNRFCQGRRDCVCRAVVGSHGDVLPKSIVLFSEVYEKKVCEAKSKKRME